MSRRAAARRALSPSRPSFALDRRRAGMGLQETLLPPGEQQITQRRRVVLAIDVGTLDRLEGREFLARQRDGKLGDSDRRVRKLGTVGRIAAQRPVGLDRRIAKILWRT